MVFRASWPMFFNVLLNVKQYDKIKMSLTYVMFDTKYSRMHNGSTSDLNVEQLNVVK